MINSFQMDVRPLFTGRDVCSNRELTTTVKKHASTIYERIRRIGGAVTAPHQKEKVLALLDLTISHVDGGWAPTLVGPKARGAASGLAVSAQHRRQD
jgi:hypothetical protein